MVCGKKSLNEQLQQELLRFLLFGFGNTQPEKQNCSNTENENKEGFNMDALQEKNQCNNQCNKAQPIIGQ
jgi:hypothetical protein